MWVYNAGSAGKCKGAAQGIGNSFKCFQVNTLSGGSLTSGLISYFKMEDASDYFSTNDLTSYGSVSLAQGKIGNAVNGGNTNSGNYLGLSNYLGISGGSISFSLWIKFLSLPSGEVDMITQSHQLPPDYSSYHITFNGTHLEFKRDRFWVEVDSAQFPWSPGIGDWNHIAGTYDGAMLRLYLKETLI